MPMPTGDGCGACGLPYERHQEAAWVHVYQGFVWFAEGLDPTQDEDEEEPADD